jgi:predicted TIM-barrel fold metal-dependent hydrolase
MKIDIFNHIFPKAYFDKMVEVLPSGKDMHKRVRDIPCIVDLDERFRIMDKFGDYAQILCLGAPPIEVYGPPPLSTEMAKIANDGMAELVTKYPKRFPGFIASLPMNDPEGLLAEARRAVKDLGAVGVQIFTNVLGRPLDKPETMPLFDLMAELDLPIWLHPARGADFPDYKSETKSHYEIWWTFGWPYETSAAMAHLVFAGLFDKHPNIKIITHHMGAMIPYFEGRSTTSRCFTRTRRSSARCPQPTVVWPSSGPTRYSLRPTLPLTRRKALPISGGPSTSSTSWTSRLRNAQQSMRGMQGSC